MSKYTETQHQTALMLVAAGKTIREIAEAVDATPGTVQRHLLQDADPYQDAKDRRADLIRSERWARAFDRGDRASAKFLDDLALEQLPETRDARRADSKLEITGDGGGPIKIESKEVSLTALLQLAADRGVLADLGLARPEPPLPAAGEIRPAPPE